MPEPHGLAEGPPAPDRSLFDDVEDLLVDAKTYVDAELSFQKSRVKYAGLSLANAVLYGVIGAAVGLVALIALSIGMILTLMPLIGALASTVIVTAVLVLVVALSLRRARFSARNLNEAIAAHREATQGRKEQE